jgi:hypothetical protein
VLPSCCRACAHVAVRGAAQGPAPAAIETGRYAWLAGRGASGSYLVLGDLRGPVPAGEGVALGAHDLALMAALGEPAHLHVAEEPAAAPQREKAG